MGQPLYGFQTPNGYSDVAENWVNTGALLERMNFALALVSNRIPGTRVDLSRLHERTRRVVRRSIKAKLLDRLVGSDRRRRDSAKTRETLLKQLSDQITIAVHGSARKTASNSAPANPFETAFQRGNLNPGGGGQQQQQLARMNPAEIDNPLVKLAGLILGSPEFQRQ